MSLQYIIDGNNIINHAKFPRNRKRAKTHHLSLLDFISINRLSGSPRNKIMVVFDGYPPSAFRGQKDYPDIEIIFSREVTADERIKQILEASENPKNTAVVSDDKQIRLFAGYLGSKVIGVEEFISPKLVREHPKKEKDLIKAELNYTQVQQINEELKRIWLK